MSTNIKADNLITALNNNYYNKLNKAKTKKRRTRNKWITDPDQIDEVKYELLELLRINREIEIVGRIRNWLLDPESRYPVSCTMMVVEDSMEGKNGIEESWVFVSRALRYGAGVSLYLKLRPKGSTNDKGLVASGVCSFMEFYSKENEIIRRGGIKYKKGGISAYIDAEHPELYIEPTRENNYATGFLNMDVSRIPWLKRALYIDDNPKSPNYILNNPHLDKILDAVRNGNLWLSKKRWIDPITNKVVNYPPDSTDIHRYRIYTQLCMEILLKSNATCLLSHINLGKVTYKTIVRAFTNGARFLCKLHAVTGVGKGENNNSLYLNPREDRQVGLGVIGLANLLAKYKITYANFADALYDWFTVLKTYNRQNLKFVYKQAKALGRKYGMKELRLCRVLHKAMIAVGRVGDSYEMERMVTVAPTISTAFRAKDSEGYTTSPEISPPIAHPETKRTTRDSDIDGAVNETDSNTVEYQYPPNIETAEQVGWENYYKLAKAWQLLMNSSGKAHAISFNIWNQCDVSLDWFKDYLNSPLITTYYRMLVDQSFNDKTNIDSGLMERLSNDFTGFFNPNESNTDSNNNNESNQELTTTEANLMNAFNQYILESLGFVDNVDLNTIKPSSCSIDNKDFCTSCQE
jgi:hypothetical protein